MNRRLLLTALSLATLLGCGDDLNSPRGSREAFVGAFTLHLLAELSPRAPVVTTLNHGDRVEIVDRRRRFVKVRARGGEEGWADGYLLFDSEQMGRMRRLAIHARQLPSQGKATVYDHLNVHTAPNRTAPSFFQLREGMEVDVLAHRLEARSRYEPPADDEDVFPKPLYLTAPDAPLPAAGADDWTLIRLPDGRAGWALTRLLTMAIPDEVAQYAEGHRIVAYFPLAAVADDGQVKHHWLWTTLSGGLKPYEFDSFRIFVWNLRRHRYETAYIERNVVGYYPVEVEPAGETTGPRAPKFSLLIRDKDDGQLYRRTYELSGYRVRMLEKALWEPQPDPDSPKLVVQTGPHAHDGGILPNLKQKVRNWLQ
ncbi:MAG: SH3 domain-containing protein [Bryobacteraceae bacterium]|nr:SH3 domain-containing protein [Bryobacteraceae bacterium]